MVLGINAARGIGAAEKGELAVKSRHLISDRIDHHDATQLEAVLGGNAGGKNAHGLDVVGFDLGAKTGRTVVGERYTVHHKLSLVFRTARVKDCVAFVEPARL